MTDTPDFLAGRLRSEGEKTIQFLRNLTQEQWLKPVYSEGGTWSIGDILAHFVSAEIGMRRLVENILSGGPGSPEDFDLDAYNQRKVAALRQVPLGELIEQFGRERENCITLIHRLSQEDLQKSGRHPWLGVVPVEEIVKLLYRHNQIHLRDIRKAVSS